MSLDNSFPNLSSSRFEVTSEFSLEYNCIAWAAGDNSRWWWPTGGYWPINDTRTTVDSFLHAFATIGYLPADDDSVEAGYEKVALYAKADHVTHAARQLAAVDGPASSVPTWTSNMSCRASKAKSTVRSRKC